MSGCDLSMESTLRCERPFVESKDNSSGPGDAGEWMLVPPGVGHRLADSVPEDSSYYYWDGVDDQELTVLHNRRDSPRYEATDAVRLIIIVDLCDHTGIQSSSHRRSRSSARSIAAIQCL